MDATFVIRDLASAADYAACVALQRETWGQQFGEVVPPVVLQIAQKMGGIAAGAFEDDVLVGFVFGITGIYESRLAHWSDMLAVRASYRNRGIGEQLKQYQRAAMLARGIERIYWSFDPLDAKNAHINFNRLGVYSREYVIDMYGDSDSPLHQVIGTDRLIAVWELAESPRAVAVEKEIAVPADIHALKLTDPTRAREWREKTRAQFLALLPEYVVTGFVRRGEAAYYALTSASNFSM